MIDVERTTVVPASLARHKGFSGVDVLETLHRDFYGKCYLCERSLSIAQVEVDHRRPQCGWPQDIHCWANLFPACTCCNKRRSRAIVRVPLLSPGEGVEHRIVQRVRFRPTGELECMFVAVLRDDARAQATAEELERLHSPAEARTARARYATIELLAMIRDRYLQWVEPLELVALRARKRHRPDLAVEARLAGLLSRRAPFTMLMRALVHPGLADLFD